MRGRSAPAPSRRGGGERFGSPAFFPNVECGSRFETAVCRKHGLRPGPEPFRALCGPGFRRVGPSASAAQGFRPKAAPSRDADCAAHSVGTKAGEPQRFGRTGRTKPAGRNRPAKPPADISGSDRRPESPVVGRKYTIRPSAAKAALGDPKAAFLAPWGRSSYTSASMRRISSAICGAVRRLARRSSCGSNRSANSLRAP